MRQSAMGFYFDIFLFPIIYAEKNTILKIIFLLNYAIDTIIKLC